MPGNKPLSFDEYKATKLAMNRAPMSFNEFKAQRITPNSVEQARIKIDPTKGMTESEKFWAGTGAGMTSFAQGIGQRARDILPENIANKLDLPTQQSVAESRRLNKPLMQTTAGQVGSFIGNLAPSMLAPGGGLIKTLASGGALGALAPTTADESVAENALYGAGGAGLAKGLFSLGGRALRPVRTTLKPSQARLAEKAQAAGINLTPAQKTGSTPLKWTESVLRDLPFSSGMQQNVTDAQWKAFNKAISKTMGSRASEFSEDTMAAIKRSVGGKIGKIAERNTLDITDDLLNKLASESDSAARFETQSTGKVVQNYIDEFLSKADNGRVSGTTYRKLDSALGRRVRGTTDGDLRNALGKLREVLRDGMDKSISPNDAAEWATLRNQYRNMKLVEPLAAKSVSGEIRPNLLLNAAIRGDKTAAYRPSELKDLGKIGKQFLTEPPSSGTAQRSMYQRVLTANVPDVLKTGAAPAAGFALGGIPGAAASLGVPPAVAAFLNSRIGNRWLTEGLLKSAQPLIPAASNLLSVPIGAQTAIQMNR